MTCEQLIAMNVNTLVNLKLSNVGKILNTQCVLNRLIAITG